MPASLANQGMIRPHYSHLLPSCLCDTLEPCYMVSTHCVFWRSFLYISEQFALIVLDTMTLAYALCYIDLASRFAIPLVFVSSCLTFSTRWVFTNSLFLTLKFHLSFFCSQDPNVFFWCPPFQLCFILLYNLDDFMRIWLSIRSVNDRDTFCLKQISSNIAFDNSWHDNCDFFADMVSVTCFVGTSIKTQDVILIHRTSVQYSVTRPLLQCLSLSMDSYLTWPLLQWHLL